MTLEIYVSSAIICTIFNRYTNKANKKKKNYKVNIKIISNYLCLMR